MSVQPKDGGVQRLGGTRRTTARSDVQRAESLGVRSQTHECPAAGARRDGDVSDALELDAGQRGNHGAHCAHEIVAQASGCLRVQLNHSGARPNGGWVGQPHRQPEAHHVVGHLGPNVAMTPRLSGEPYVKCCLAPTPAVAPSLEMP